jgi:uncharacterized membrane protein
MTEIDILWFARALHVIGVALWIGGVAFVTTVMLPAINSSFAAEKRLAEFERYERRFAFQAKVSTLLVGLTGFYMVFMLGLWSRFQQIAFWWMHAMLMVWTLFMALLFVIEPLFFHRFLQMLARRDPSLPLRVLQRGHRMLLVISLVTVAGAVAGSHGWLI